MTQETALILLDTVRAAIQNHKQVHCFTLADAADNPKRPIRWANFERSTYWLLENSEMSGLKEDGEYVPKEDILQDRKIVGEFFVRWGMALKGEGK
jgi:hypothetical protein